MAGRIVDGERWIAERLRFLRERLSGDLPASERQAVEREIEALSHEGGLSVHGLRWPRFLRRLRRR